MKPRTIFPLATVGIALLFGVTVILPSIWQRTDAGYPFQGVQIMPSDAEIHYAARVREFYDGHYAVSNTYYKERKDVPYLQPPYPEGSIAITARILGVDPAALFVWSKAFFAFVLTLLLVGCAVSLSGRKWESLLAVTGLLFAGSVLSAPWDISHLLAGDQMFEVLRFSRPINPLWTVSWFAAALWFLSEWLRRRSTWMMVGSALCTVVLLFSYVYAWTFLGVAMSVLFIRFLWLRDWPRVRDLLLFLVLFLVLGSPYLMNLWQSMHHPFYETSALRLGMSNIRTPVIGVWAILFLGVTLCTRKIWKEQWWLVLGLAIASIVALNQHIVTGAYLVPHHYHWYFVQPLAALTTMIVVLSLVQNLPLTPNSPSTGSGQALSPAQPSLWLRPTGGGKGAFMRSAFVVIVLFLLIACGVLVQARAYDTSRDEWGNMQRFGPVVESLKQLPADAAVYGQELALMDLLPVYTSLNVYYSSNANNYLVDPQHIRDVYWFELWIKGVTADEVLGRFKTDLRYTTSSRIYSIYYREYLGAYDRIPDDVLETLAGEYQQYLTLSTQEKLCKWPLEYVVFADTDTVTPAWNEIRANTHNVLTDSGFTVRQTNEGLCR